ncbi:hypothetical protein [Paenibacillus sp. TH7-28]
MVCIPPGADGRVNPEHLERVGSERMLRRVRELTEVLLREHDSGTNEWRHIFERRPALGEVVRICLKNSRI